MWTLPHAALIASVVVYCIATRSLCLIASVVVYCICQHGSILHCHMRPVSGCQHGRLYCHTRLVLDYLSFYCHQ